MVSSNQGEITMTKRIQGSNLLKNCKLRQKQMRYLLDNMSEPDFSLIECSNALNDTFNTSEETLNTAGITFRILNSQGVGTGKHSSNTLPTWASVAVFMANIQCYLPKSLQTKQNPFRLWRRNSFQQNDTQIIAEDTQELLDDMCDWLETMKRKIQDYITARYFREGKIQYIEMLKRRYKDEWSEKVEQEVVADVQQETNFNLVIEDYTGDEND
jgi:hypothetical protein